MPPAVEIDPAVDPAWRALMELHPSGLFHAPPWLGVLADTYGFAPRALLLRDGGGAPAAAVAFCVVDDMLGRRIVSLPFTDACDPLAGTQAEWSCLAEALRARGLPVRLRCLDDRLAAADPGTRVAKRARWHSLAVAASEAAQWAALDEAPRRAVRKAARAGVVVRPLPGGEGVAGLHRLHVALRKRKYRLLAQPIEFFEALRQRFSAVDGWFPLGAFHDGRLIAATLFLRWRDTLYYKFNASAAEELETRPNNALLWSGLALARSLGCARLDLGPSDDDQPGLIRFKRGFGAEERELLHLDLAVPGAVPDAAAEARRLLGDLTVLLTAPEVPDAVAAAAGRRLYRYFA